MSINFNLLRKAGDKNVMESEVRRILRAENYGFEKDQWNLTDVINTQDNIKFLIYSILDGERRTDGTKLPPLMNSMGQQMTFRLKVLSRFACIRDKDGNKIWHWTQAKLEHGSDNDIIPDPLEKPKPGDIIEVKGDLKVWDYEHNRKVTNSVIKEWAVRNIRPENFYEYTLDKDLCAEVPFPYVLSLLQKNGKQIAFPQFKKIYRKTKHGTDSEPEQLRRLTNWYFSEVSKDYTLKKIKKTNISDK